jgi:hypothetical protein
MPIALNQFTLATTLDPTAQKIADLEARLAKLESVLSVGVNGEATLKSTTVVTIEAGTNLSMRAGVTAKLESGATMSLKASASSEMLAAGTLDIRGSMVNIN